MSEVAIGIDLGTSNSCVAVARGRRVEVLPNAYGENITASVVCFQEDGNIVVGNAAKANIIHDPKNTVSSAKRLIGRYYFSEEVKKAQAVCAYDIVGGPNHGVRIQIRDEQFSLAEISAMVLREMKLIAEEQLGHEVRKAVITVPAYFNDNQRQATKDAGRIAGLEVLRLLNEPTAAALAYGFGKGVDQRVAVYDLGGGTFDVSVLEIGKDVFEVLSTCGDTYLGGDDFDDRLIDLLADEFAAKEGINLRNDVYALEKLKLAAENAKKGLSVEEQVEINIPDIVTGSDGQPRSIQRSITGAEFSSLVMDLIQRTFKVCDEALQQANMIARDLDGVILVGGPTRLPLIRQAVAEYFQQEPKADVDPDEVVAMGASIHAASLMSSSQDSYLLDVTPLSLRIGVAGGLAESVIERNTPVPIEQTRTFTTFQDYQESVNIRVYQGESRRAAENELLGQFEFSGFKRARRGEVKIDVTFEINSDGLVNVTATDQDTGQRASTQISLSSGLSDDDISRIVQEGKVDRVRNANSESAPVAAAPAAAAAAEPDPVAPAPEASDLLGADDLEVLDEDDDTDLELDEDLSAALSGPEEAASQELVAAPEAAEEIALDAGPAAEALQAPELGASDLEVAAPVLDAPDPGGHELPGPELDGPEIDAPGIDAPALEGPELLGSEPAGDAAPGPSIELDAEASALLEAACAETEQAPVAAPPMPEAPEALAAPGPAPAAAESPVDYEATIQDQSRIELVQKPSGATAESSLGLGDLEEFELTLNSEPPELAGEAPDLAPPPGDATELLETPAADPAAETVVASEAGDSLFEEGGSDLSELYDDSEEL